MYVLHVVGNRALNVLNVPSRNVPHQETSHTSPQSKSPTNENLKIVIEFQGQHAWFGQLAGRDHYVCRHSTYLLYSNLYSTNFLCWNICGVRFWLA